MLKLEYAVISTDLKLYMIFALLYVMKCMLCPCIFYSFTSYAIWTHLTQEKPTTNKFYLGNVELFYFSILVFISIFMIIFNNVQNTLPIEKH